MIYNKEVSLTNVTIKANETGTQEPGTTMAQHQNLGVYIGVSVGIGILLCVLVIFVIILYRRRSIQRNASIPRRLFIRGFSTISQRGVLDSTGEFEISNMMSGSGEDDSGNSSTHSTKSTSAPKKPQRKKTRTSSSNAPTYENVTVNPAGRGYFSTKSASASSDIPYMDTTLESRLSRDGEDEVFE